MKRILLLPLCAFVLLSACQKNTTDEELLSVRLKGCADKAFVGETVRICFDSVLQDSRCPVYAVCVWAGVAQVKLTVRVGNSSYPIVLSTLQAPGFVRDTTIQQYRISLQDVQPHPGDSTFVPPPTVSLAIVRK